MTVYDVSDPERTATAPVTILVNRNSAGPVCEFSPFRFSFLEYKAVPSIIGRVNAIDQSGVSLVFIFLLSLSLFTFVCVCVCQSNHELGSDMIYIALNP